MRKIYGAPMFTGWSVDREFLTRVVRQLAMDIVSRWPNVKEDEWHQLKWCCTRLGLQLVCDTNDGQIYFEEIKACRR